MAVDLEKEGGLDLGDAEVQQMLGNIQGNILKGHGRPFTRHIFLSFSNDVSSVKKWLANFARSHVTSAQEQQGQVTLFKADLAQRPFASIFISATGYERLGIASTQIPNLFVEEVDDLGTTAKFRDGMKASGPNLNDAPTDTWDPKFRNRIDAMILLAHAKENELESLSNHIKGNLGSAIKFEGEELGKAMKKGTAEVEHFGYSDGISQPQFFKADEPSESDKAIFDPMAHLGLVLVKDPNTTAENAFGSYFVFRKLEQNVRGFKTEERRIAKELSLPDHRLAGAMAVGRFEDGTPLVLHNAPTPDAGKENTFNYAEDMDGSKCPFHAHIRKSNPRGDIRRKFGPNNPDLDKNERSRRIVRRGITYGDRDLLPGDETSLDQLPTENVGLLFMCYQSSIAHQFAFMQRGWCNSAGFLNDDTGRDPVIGQKGSEPEATNKWPTAWNGNSSRNLSFAEFVKLKGGEFFFAPSMPYLLNLAPPQI